MVQGLQATLYSVQSIVQCWVTERLYCHAHQQVKSVVTFVRRWGHAGRQRQHSGEGRSQRVASRDLVRGGGVFKLVFPRPQGTRLEYRGPVRVVIRLHVRGHSGSIELTATRRQLGTELIGEREMGVVTYS